ncbi:MAG: hypothetical protein PUD16_06760 [bacterium]|nr:hypothetical protein [bacterium]
MFKWIPSLAEAVVDALPTAEPVAETVVAEATNALVELPLLTKGLLTTLMGLLGVFLVLTLFFITIKLMQKIGK